MALTSLDERDLLLPLYDGVREDPAWETFLRRLKARTGATHVSLMVRPTHRAHLPPVRRAVSETHAFPSPDYEMLAELGVVPLERLRPDRVYALDEMMELENTALSRKQRAALRDADIAHARMIRVVARAGHEAWLVLFHVRKPFTASDSALLSSLAPHLASAATAYSDAEVQRLRLEMAEDALALLGIGQAALDRDGRVIAADQLATRLLDVTPGNRLAPGGGKAQELAGVCTALAGKASGARETMRLPERAAPDMLLRPGGDEETVFAAVRQPQRKRTQGAARIIARLLGVSEREAALADAIAHGAGIVEAGAALQLTPETARNYTKRIYAKTGATGQADLVRLLLSGLTPLA